MQLTVRISRAYQLRRDLLGLFVELMGWDLPQESPRPQSP